MAGFDTKQIWKVFFILLAITVLEFLIALTPALEGIRTEYKLAVNLTYVILTLFKAFYIIAYFMHLKFDSKIFSFLFYTGLGLALFVYIVALATFKFFIA